MCFKTKISTPKVKAAEIVAPPEPLKDSPSGVQFGGSDEDNDTNGSSGSSEVSGVSSLKVKSDSSIKNEQADSTTKQVSGTAKKAVRKSVFNSSTR